MKKEQRCHTKHFRWLPVLAVCLALLLTILFLLPLRPDTPPTSGSEKGTKLDTDFVESPQTGDLKKETFGELQLGMTMTEVTDLLGAPVTTDDEICWNYESLIITFHPFSERVSEIQALPGCSLVLDSGIGLGSTIEDVIFTYPLAFETDEEPDGDRWFYIDDLEFGLQIRIRNGTVDEIIWEDYSDPMLDALTVNELTLYAADGREVRAIDKAAKRICTIMTISVPEEAPSPEGSPIGWIDFGNGTAVYLYDKDYAAIFRYEGTFAPKTLQNSTPYLDGIFLGIEDAFAQALKNPTETW